VESVHRAASLHCRGTTPAVDEALQLAVCGCKRGFLGRMYHLRNLTLRAGILSWLRFTYDFEIGSAQLCCGACIGENARTRTHPGALVSGHAVQLLLIVPGERQTTRSVPACLPACRPGPPAARAVDHPRSCDGDQRSPQVYFMIRTASMTEITLRLCSFHVLF
jgi:hypothetical protein